MLNALRRSKERRQTAARLHAVLVARAREPVFFARFGVGDTLDGRFDLMALHAWLMLDRLAADGPLAQAFVDEVFVGFDEAFREMGAGDIGMGKRMKKVADAFYGRTKAYGEAADETAMAAALVRNLYRGQEAPGAAALAHYVLGARRHLHSCSEGALDFGPLPGAE